MPFPTLSLSTLKSSLLCCKKRHFTRKRGQRDLHISAPTNPQHLPLPPPLRFRTGVESYTPSSTHLLSPLSSHPPSPSLSPFPSLSPSPSTSSSTSSLPRLRRKEDIQRVDEVCEMEEVEYDEVEERLPNAASGLPDSLPTPPRCRGDGAVVRVRGMLCPPALASTSLLESGARGRERDCFEGYGSSSDSESLGSGAMEGGSVFGDGGEGRMLDVDVGIGDGVLDLEVEKEWGCGVRVKGGGSEGWGE